MITYGEFINEAEGTYNDPFKVELGYRECNVDMPKFFINSRGNLHETQFKDNQLTKDLGDVGFDNNYDYEFDESTFKLIVKYYFEFYTHGNGITDIDLNIRNMEISFLVNKIDTDGETEEIEFSFSIDGNDIKNKEVEMEKLPLVLEEVDVAISGDDTGEIKDAKNWEWTFRIGDQS